MCDQLRATTYPHTGRLKNARNAHNNSHSHTPTTSTKAYKRTIKVIHMVIEVLRSTESLQGHALIFKAPSWAHDPKHSTEYISILWQGKHTRPWQPPNSTDGY